MNLTRRQFALAALGAPLLSPGAFAQEAYPARPVTIVADR